MNALQQFLREQPQWLTGTTFRDVQGRRELDLSRDAILAFAQWAVERGLITPDKVAALVASGQQQV